MCYTLLGTWYPGSWYQVQNTRKHIPVLYWYIATRTYIGKKLGTTIAFSII